MAIWLAINNKEIHEVVYFEIYEKLYKNLINLIKEKYDDSKDDDHYLIMGLRLIYEDIQKKK